MANNTTAARNSRSFFAISRALLRRVFSISPTLPDFLAAASIKNSGYRWCALRCSADKKKG